MMENKEENSKNMNAERIMGMRKEGTPFQSAWELGYVCPICHTKGDINGDDFDEDTLIRFSEYYGFLWCPVCNIDLPFAFCFEGYFEEIRKNQHDSYSCYYDISSCFLFSWHKAGKFILYFA